MTSKSQSDFLNLTRWVAAALVVIEHARNLCFVDYGSIANPSVFQKAFYFLTGFGHEAVVVFFVISGFLVGGKAWDSFRKNEFDWRRYLANRVSRLYAVLIAALLLGFALDWVGANYFNEFGFYSGEAAEQVVVVPGVVYERLDAPHFLASLFMLQEIVLPSFGSNGPLWSLAHEWWYYLLFPLILFALRSSAAVRVIAISCLAALCWMLTPYILVLFGVWLIGVVGWRFNQCQLLSWKFSLFLFASSLFAMRLEVGLFPFAHQYLLGIGFALLLNSLSKIQLRFPVKHLSRRLADFSYTLYLVHFPVLLLTIAMLFSISNRTTRFEVTFSTLVWFLLVVSVAFGVSWLVSLTTEAKTPQIRAWLYSVMDIDKKSPVRLALANSDHQSLSSNYPHKVER